MALIKNRPRAATSIIVQKTRRYIQVFFKKYSFKSVCVLDMPYAQWPSMIHDHMWTEVIEAEVIEASMSC